MKSKLLIACLIISILSSQVLVAEEKQHSAVSPAHRHSWWTLRNDAVNERVEQGNVDFLFIGDSITHGWEGGGKEYWDKYYEPRNAVNMGFSGDRTQHVLWRLDHGHLEGISPKLAVLMIGTNNSNGKDNTKASLLASKIADGKMIHYLDINDKFLTKDGLLSKDIMPDYLHPNKAGYKIWAEAIEPKVAELMGEKSRK